MDRSLDRELSYYRLQAAWTRAMRIHLYRRINLMARTRILDIGCADGFVTAQIAERTKGTVVGVDRSEEMIARAQHEYPNIEFHCADACRLPFDDGSFDAVIADFTLMWIGQPQRALAEARRVLSPGGVILASGEPDYGGRIDEPGYLALLSEAWIAAIKKEGGDPFLGRRLKGLLAGAGFRSVEIGVMSSLWEGAEGDMFDAYLDALLYFLADAAPDIRKIVAEEKKAAHEGRRLVFLPIFWGIGEREKRR